MKILIVDDHPLLHEVLGAVARKVFADAALGFAQDLEEALERGRSEKELDLVLLDLGLPGCQGIEALVRFKKTFPAVRVIVISANEERDCVLRSFGAGAVGYIPKTYATPLMVNALRFVADGGKFVPPLVLEADRSGGAPSRGHKLTQRQIEVARLIPKGHPNKEIARRLKIAEETVKHHVRNVYLALGITSRSQVAAAAARHGINVD